MPDVPAALVRSLVLRYMRGSPYFTRAGNVQRAPLGNIPGDEELIGWYENPSPHKQLLVFTTDALYVVTKKRTQRVAIETLVEKEGYQLGFVPEGLWVWSGKDKILLPCEGAFGSNGQGRCAALLALAVDGFFR